MSAILRPLPALPAPPTRLAAPTRLAPPALLIAALAALLALAGCQGPPVAPGLTVTYVAHPAGRPQERGPPFNRTLVEQADGLRTWRLDDGSLWIERAVVPSGGLPLDETYDGPTRTMGWDFSALYPLSIGASVTRRPGLFDGFPVDLGADSETCTVFDREVIEVPAGRFDAFQVACSIEGGLFTAGRTSFFHLAPDLPVFLRRETPGLLLAPGTVWELVSITEAE